MLSKWTAFGLVAVGLIWGVPRLVAKSQEFFGLTIPSEYVVELRKPLWLDGYSGDSERPTVMLELPKASLWSSGSSNRLEDTSTVLIDLVRVEDVEHFRRAKAAQIRGLIDNRSIESAATLTRDPATGLFRAYFADRVFYLLSADSLEPERLSANDPLAICAEFEAEPTCAFSMLVDTHWAVESTHVPLALLAEYSAVRSNLRRLLNEWGS